MLPAFSKKNQTNSNNRQKQSRTTTPSTPKTPNKNDSTKSSKENRISLLEARIRQLEQKVELLESSLIVAKNTNPLLKKQVDHLQHTYQQRACIDVDGIKSDGQTEDHSCH